MELNKFSEPAAGTFWFRLRVPKFRYLRWNTARIVLGGMADYVDATEAIELEVLCLTGEGFNFKLDKSTLGYKVQQMVSTQLPGREGAKIVLHHMCAKLVLAKSLEQQGIVRKTATLSCTYVPTDLYLAWCCVQGFPTPEAEYALEGLASLKVRTPGQYLFHLPKSLRSLILDQPQTYFRCVHLCKITLPSSLQNLTFGQEFNQRLENVSLPSSLQNLTFGEDFNQSLENVTLPSSLQSLTFGREFNRSLENVTLPSSLLDLTFGQKFNQSFDNVTLPSSLQNLTFGEDFSQSLERVTFPSTLESLEILKEFEQIPWAASCPNLRRLVIGSTVMSVTEWETDSAGYVVPVLVI